MFNILKSPVYRKLYLNQIKNYNLPFILGFPVMLIFMTLVVNAKFIHDHSTGFSTAQIIGLVIFNLFSLCFILFIGLKSFLDKTLISNTLLKMVYDNQVDNSFLMRFLEEPDLEHNSIDRKFICSKKFRKIIHNNIHLINHQNNEKETFLHEILKRIDSEDPDIQALVFYILQYECVDIYICDENNQSVFHYLNTEQQAFVIDQEKKKIKSNIPVITNNNTQKSRL